MCRQCASFSAVLEAWLPTPPIKLRLLTTTFTVWGTISSTPPQKVWISISSSSVIVAFRRSIRIPPQKASRRAPCFGLRYGKWSPHTLWAFWSVFRPREELEALHEKGAVRLDLPSYPHTEYTRIGLVFLPHRSAVSWMHGENFQVLTFMNLSCVWYNVQIAASVPYQ